MGRRGPVTALAPVEVRPILKRPEAAVAELAAARKRWG